jgi:chromosome segregation ATPase
MPELTQGESLVRNRDIDEIDALIAERDKLKEEVEWLKNSDSFYLDEVAENKRLVERVSELEGALDKLEANRKSARAALELCEQNYEHLEAERDKLKEGLDKWIDRWDDDTFEAEQTIAKLFEMVSELEGALHFFRSVIQSGEGWTDHCEKTYRAALEKIKFRNHPGTTNHELAKEALSRTSEEA